MEKVKDFRLDKSIFNNMINKEFKKYRHDPFLFTNTVYQIVGLYIGDSIYKILNESVGIERFGTYDDWSVWNIKEVDDEKEIKSGLLNQDQIDTPVNEIINRVSLVNENQKITIDGINYNVWVTRAIIFHLDSKDIYFEKDNTAFSEEIEIKRGHDLLKEFPKYNDFFMEEWDEGIKPEIETEFVTIG